LHAIIFIVLTTSEAAVILKEKQQKQMIQGTESLVVITVVNPLHVLCYSAEH